MLDHQRAIFILHPTGAVFLPLRRRGCVTDSAKSAEETAQVEHEERVETNE